MNKSERTLHVLLVEDDQQQREIIASILQSSRIEGTDTQAYQVTSAANAEEAMLAIKNSLNADKIDVVFSDWKLRWKRLKRVLMII